MVATHLFTPDTVVWIAAPHADDEALGCGGVIAAARARGAQVYVLFLTVSGYAPLDAGAVSSHDERMRELETAMKIARVSACDVLFENGKHHCYLDTVPVKELLDWLERGSECSYRKLQPDVVLLPSGLHSHQDHRRAHEAMMALVRVNPVDNGHSRLILEYEIPGMCLPGCASFQPNVYVPLTKAELDAKCEMFGCYRSQLAPPPHARSEHAIRALAAYRGVEAGCLQAEAFRLVRGVFGGV